MLRTSHHKENTTTMYEGSTYTCVIILTGALERSVIIREGRRERKRAREERERIMSTMKAVCIYM